MGYISHVVLYKITNVMIQFDPMQCILHILFAQSSQKHVRWELLANFTDEGVSSTKMLSFLNLNFWLFLPHQVSVQFFVFCFFKRIQCSFLHYNNSVEGCTLLRKVRAQRVVVLRVDNDQHVGSYYSYFFHSIVEQVLG